MAIALAGSPSNPRAGGGANGTNDHGTGSVQIEPAVRVAADDGAQEPFAQAPLGAHAGGGFGTSKGGLVLGNGFRHDVLGEAGPPWAASMSRRLLDEAAQRAAEWTGRVFVRASEGMARSGEVRGGSPALPVQGIRAGCDACAEGVIDAICRYDWPCDEALRVVYGPTPTCPTGEGGGNWSTENGPNKGGFQVNIDAHPYTREQMLDPEQNIAAAYGIWLDSGGNWSAWSCSP